MSVNRTKSLQPLRAVYLHNFSLCRSFHHVLNLSCLASEILIVDNIPRWYPRRGYRDYFMVGSFVRLYSWVVKNHNKRARYGRVSLCFFTTSEYKSYKQTNLVCVAPGSRIHLNFTNIEAAIVGKSSSKRFWKNSSQCWEKLLQVK